MNSKFSKARDWLNKMSKFHCAPIWVGNPIRLAGIVYKIKRVDKASLWFCVDSNGENITKIKRICV